MIDPADFRAFLMFVCILATIAAALLFGSADAWFHVWYKQFLVRLFALVLGGYAAIGVALLCFLK